MNTAIVGGLGYVGHFLIQALPDPQNAVIIDPGYFSTALVYPRSGSRPTPLVVHARGHDSNYVDNVHAVVYLGEPSTESCFNDNAQLQYHTLDNLMRTVSRIEPYVHFIYISSMSVYGETQGGTVNFNTAPRPNTAYGKLKLAAEQYIQRTISPSRFTILRLGTVFGPAPTMRFDSVINNFVGQALAYEAVKCNTVGNQLRPFVYGGAVADAIYKILVDPSSHAGRIYDVASTYNCATIKEVALEVSKVANVPVGFGQTNPPETLSYRCAVDVSCDIPWREGVRRTYETLKHNKFSARVMEHSEFNRAKHLKKLTII